MDELWRNHVPPFGSWDHNNDLPFTECFESARQAGLLRYSYSQDQDLYFAGDLYQNDVVTPTMIVVPRRKGKKRDPHVKVGKREEKWVVCEYDYNSEDYKLKQPPSPPPPLQSQSPSVKKAQPKPIDEDLYKISPHLLYAKPKKNNGWRFLSSCLICGG